MDPDRDALVDVAGDRRWTYGELNAEVDVIARGLMSLGIEKGGLSRFEYSTNVGI